MQEDLHSKDLSIKTENYTVRKTLDLRRALNIKDIDELKESIYSTKTSYEKITITHANNTYSVDNLEGLLDKSGQITINVVSKTSNNSLPNYRMIEQNSHWCHAEDIACSIEERVKDMLNYHP